MKAILIFLNAVLIFSIAACSSMSTLPKADNVKVSREDADKDCTFISKVEGRTMSKIPKEGEALADLTKEAANKGANYLVVKEYSGNGTAVTGLAYKCP
jgi:hypothetical protein